MISHLNGNFFAMAARSADSLASLRTYKRADRADVNDTEFGQLLSDLRWLATIGSADVHRA
jgi:hypothetical protein